MTLRPIHNALPTPLCQEAISRHEAELATAKSAQASAAQDWKVCLQTGAGAIASGGTHLMRVTRYEDGWWVAQITGVVQHLIIHS